MLRLPERLHRRLIHEAAAAPDREVCGLVGGTAGRGGVILPVANARRRADAFDMEPAGLIAALRHLRETGRDLAAIYHSHPASAPYPSATDLAANRYPATPHLIIGREAGGWRVRAFLLDGAIEEQRLVIGEEGRPPPTGTAQPG